MSGQSSIYKNNNNASTSRRRSSGRSRTQNNNSNSNDTLVKLIIKSNYMSEYIKKLKKDDSTFLEDAMKKSRRTSIKDLGLKSSLLFDSKDSESNVSHPYVEDLLAHRLVESFDKHFLVNLLTNAFKPEVDSEIDGHYVCSEHFDNYISFYNTTKIFERCFDADVCEFFTGTRSTFSHDGYPEHVNLSCLTKKEYLSTFPHSIVEKMTRISEDSVRFFWDIDSRKSNIFRDSSWSNWSDTKLCLPPTPTNFQAITSMEKTLESLRDSLLANKSGRISGVFSIRIGILSELNYNTRNNNNSSSSSSSSSDTNSLLHKFPNFVERDYLNILMLEVVVLEKDKSTEKEKKRRKSYVRKITDFATNATNQITHPSSSFTEGTSYYERKVNIMQYSKHLFGQTKRPTNWCVIKMSIASVMKYHIQRMVKPNYSLLFQQLIKNIANDINSFKQVKDRIHQIIESKVEDINRICINNINKQKYKPGGVSQRYQLILSPKTDVRVRKRTKVIPDGQDLRLYVTVNRKIAEYYEDSFDTSLRSALSDVNEFLDLKGVQELTVDMFNKTVRAFKFQIFKTFCIPNRQESGFFIFSDVSESYQKYHENFKTEPKIYIDFFKPTGPLQQVLNDSDRMYAAYRQKFITDTEQLFLLSHRLNTEHIRLQVFLSDIYDCVYWTKKTLSPNVWIYGGKERGKSTILKNLKKSLVKNTYKELQQVTEAVFRMTSRGKQDYKHEIFEDRNMRNFFEDITSMNSYLSEAELRTIKMQNNSLSNGNSCDRKNERFVERFPMQISATNSSAEDFLQNIPKNVDRKQAEALLSRHIYIEIKNSWQGVFNQSCYEHDSTKLEPKYTAFQRFIRYSLFQINNLIRHGVISPIDTEKANKYINVITNAYSKQIHFRLFKEEPKEDTTTRTKEHILKIAVTHCLRRTLLYHIFKNKNGQVELIPLHELADLEYKISLADIFKSCSSVLIYKRSEIEKYKYLRELVHLKVDFYKNHILSEQTSGLDVFQKTPVDLLILENDQDLSRKRKTCTYNYNKTENTLPYTTNCAQQIGQQQNKKQKSNAGMAVPRDNVVIKTENKGNTSTSCRSNSVVLYPKSPVEKDIVNLTNELLPILRRRDNGQQCERETDTPSPTYFDKKGILQNNIKKKNEANQWTNFLTNIYGETNLIEFYDKIFEQQYFWLISYKESQRNRRLSIIIYYVMGHFVRTSTLSGYVKLDPEFSRIDLHRKVKRNPKPRNKTLNRILNHWQIPRPIRNEKTGIFTDSHFYDTECWAEEDIGTDDSLNILRNLWKFELDKFRYYIQWILKQIKKDSLLERELSGKLTAFLLEWEKFRQDQISWLDKTIEKHDMSDYHLLSPYINDSKAGRYIHIYHLHHYNDITHTYWPFTDNHRIEKILTREKKFEGTEMINVKLENVNTDLYISSNLYIPSKIDVNGRTLRKICEAIAELESMKYTKDQEIEYGIKHEMCKCNDKNHYNAKIDYITVKFLGLETNERENRYDELFQLLGIADSKTDKNFFYPIDFEQNQKEKPLTRNSLKPHL